MRISLLPKYRPMYPQPTAIWIRLVVIAVCVWLIGVYTGTAHSGTFGTGWYVFTVSLPVVMIIACLGRLIWFAYTIQRNRRAVR